MAQDFSFPPPPPPPPRKESIPNLLERNLGNRRSYGQAHRGRSDWFWGNRPRGDVSRGRGCFAKGRGGAGSFRDNFRNGGLNYSTNNNSEQHGESLGQPYHSQGPHKGLISPYYGEKRSYGAAFSKPVTSLARTQAAPAVPTFGGEILPCVKSQPGSPTASKKKARKHNQLGLTPASLDHESSSDEDEEVKLACGTASATDANSALLQFEYKGRTATLNTTADIEAWIAERKRRFPTAAKAEAARKEAEDKKRKWQEHKKEKAESLRLQKQEREKTRQGELRQRALESVATKQAKKEEDKTSEFKQAMHADDFVKATWKEEKLKRKLEKAQRDARKAEEALARMQKGAGDVKVCGSESTTSSYRFSKLPEPSDLSTSVEETADQKPTQKLSAELVKHETLPVSDASPISSDISSSDVAENNTETDEGEDDTSSSGSSPISRSDSASGAEVSPVSASHLVPSSDANADPGPEELTSKRTAPEHVPPLPRVNPSKKSAHTSTRADPDHSPQRNLCRNLLRTGRCHFGERCRYEHALVERDVYQHDKIRRKGKASGNDVGKRNAGRKSLYQVMVEKEVEQERREILQVIVEMGERGMLKEPNAENDEVGQREER